MCLYYANRYVSILSKSKLWFNYVLISENETFFNDNKDNKNESIQDGG